MYKFSDISDSEIPGEGRKMRKGNGCFISASTGIIIALLAIAISVGVGLIVHFAENRALECNFPKLPGNDGSVLQQAQTGTKVTSQAPAVASKATKESISCPTLPTTLAPPSPVTSKTTPLMTEHIRLPKSWKPTHYRLKIRPHMYSGDPSRFSFEGNVTIEMICIEATSVVTLHVNQLEIFSPRFGSTSDSSPPSSQSHTEDKQGQFLIINLDKSAQVGKKYFLEMAFIGPLKDDMKGLYLSSYKTGDKTVYAAATQFEPTDARKAFPCFDEPQLKATFDVTLSRRKHLKSVSNMPIKNQIPIGNDMVEDHFETSRVMSTYLLAFVIGDFDYTAKNTSNGLLYRAWATPSSVDQTKTALDVGVKSITNYEKYFGIDFPLPKQDMIALPDAAASAMENWGLITYQQTAMLYQPGDSSQRDLERVTTTITHEVAHQWFGDLVTMEWWDDLWLNEGFATFVEFLGADIIYPDWKMFEQFAVNIVQAAFEVDSLVTSHPIYVPVNNPDEINEIFDTISYSKGASVIRMARFVLGEETFQKGIQMYLKRKQYRNAVHDDLWQALTNQSITDGHRLDVKEFMDTWILQMNYPVVEVAIRNDKIALRQNRFLADPDARDPGKYPSPFDYKWKIPFTYTSAKKANFFPNASDVHWLHGETAEISYPGIQTEDWILGNIQQYGFYRVTYEDYSWAALVTQLKKNHKVIHTINRAQIIDDAWSLARARQLSTSIALGTLEYLQNELEYVPWVAAQRQMDYLDKMLRRTELYGQFQTFMKNTVMLPYKHYGMDNRNSSHIETYIRSDIAKMACSYGISSCVTKSKLLFKGWMANPSNNTIHPDLRSTVYCTAISEGGSEEWDFAYKQSKVASVASEKATIMGALACTKSTWLLSRYLKMAIVPAEIKKQDAVKVMVYVSQNPIGQDLAWGFVRANWGYLMKVYGKGVFSFATLISGITTSFNTEFQLNQLQDFLAKNPYMGTGTRAFTHAIEKTETNIKWMKQNKEIVSDWLQTVINPKDSARVTDVRLPRHLLPRRYGLTIQPNMYKGDPAKFNFEGHVKIILEAVEVGSNVTLHTNKLTIEEDTIMFGREDGVPEGPVYSGERTYDEERQFEIFSLDKDVIVGEQYFIEMNFTGPLTGDLAGLYLSQYQRGNTTVYLATTQFEATDARKAFPCMDEPDLKAEFDIKLVRKSNLKSLSNMPIIGNETWNDGLVMDIFKTSPNMSTYLVCMIICDFEFTEGQTSTGIHYRAWARPESINQTSVALEAGVRIIDYFTSYFGIAFPLPKEDMIAIPDFRAGAMENWGLITYRETAMLYEEGVSSASNLQRVDIVIAHELAHMWFGDLVTMDWWDDLWLNEGFATFVEYMGVDHLHPDWKMFEQIVIELYGVFEADALVTSHPIYVPVDSPVEISAIFDSISYGKGSLIIRMMRFFLNESVFQEGVQIYLKSRKYSNANHNDLWDGLQQAAEKAGIIIDVRGIMDTWILQMNYPVVMVTKSASGKIVLQQKRFLSNPDAVDPGKYPSPYNYTWQVPFTYTKSFRAEFNQSSEEVIWLQDKELELHDNYPTPGEWVLGNIQQLGVYRVNYEESNWKELIKQLKNDYKVIHTLNRGQIIKDAFGLAKAGELSMSIALETVEYLNKETAYIPWVAAGEELGYIDIMLRESSIYGLFQKFMKTITGQQFSRLGLNDTSSDHLTSLLRSSIVSKACGYGNVYCETEAYRLFVEYMASKVNTIDPGVRSTVYCTALRQGGEEEWNFIFDEYKTANVAAEKSRLMSALSCTRGTWLLYRMLELTFEEDIIRKQDAYLVYGAVSNNEVGTLIVWNFFRENWDRIFAEFKLSVHSIISSITSTFNTEFILEQMKEFKAQHPDMGRGTSAFSKAIESVEGNILWMKKNYQTVKQWLEKMETI